MTGMSICALCCVQFPPPTKRRGRSNALSPELERLWASKQTGVVGGGGVLEGKGKHEILRDLAKWLCSKCLGELKGIGEKRREVDGAEKDVRRLQLKAWGIHKEVIRMLRGLQRTVEEFKEEVWRMEWAITVEGANQERELEEFFGQEGGTAGGRLEEALWLRRKMLEVFQVLTALQLTSDTKTGNAQDAEVKVEVDLDMQAVDEDAVASGDEHLIGHPWIPEDQEEPENNEPPPISDENIETQPEAEGSRFKDDTIGDFDIEVPDDEGDDWEPEKEGGDANAGYDDEKPYSSRFSTRDPKYRVAKHLPKKTKLKMSRMSTFKRGLIMRCLKRIETSKKKRKNRVPETGYNAIFEDINPMKQHELTYDPDTDTLNLAGFQLTIDDKSQCVQCTACGHQCKLAETNHPDKSIFNHIFGFHLNLYQCPQCPTNSTDFSNFRRHILGHRQAFNCKICGKPMMGQTSLARHKWTHMNQEEKEEAIRNGEKYPENYKPEVRPQCTICKKFFVSAGGLNIHLKTHQAPQQICPQCGKLFRNMDYHRKFVCWPGKQEGVPREMTLKFECNICLNKFQSAKLLKHHKAGKHGNERPYQCHLCGKAFKTKGENTTHLKTHSEERPFECRAGCGKKYKKKKNLKYHEQRCELLLGNAKGAEEPSQVAM